jgi:hypothetical protein
MGDALIGGSSDGIERRVFLRVEVATLSCVVHVRLPPGREAILLNVSEQGACIEAASRLLPGAHVEVQIAAPGWLWRGQAVVRRCRVSPLLPDNGARYLAALQFDIPLGPGGPAALLEAARNAIASGNTLPGGETEAHRQWAVTTRKEPIRSGAEGERLGIPPK